MWLEHAQFQDGSVSVEAGLMEMLDRMQTGRFKVLKHLDEWFQEFRLYHRRDGRVVKERDDLLAATRYGVMMLRCARTEAARQKLRPRDWQHDENHGCRGMTDPIYVTAQTVQRTDRHPGAVCEGWYRIASGFVELTGQDGTPINDDRCRQELGPDDATIVARRLLRAQHDRKVSRRPYSGPLPPMTWGSIA